MALTYVDLIGDRQVMCRYCTSSFFVCCFLIIASILCWWSFKSTCCKSVVFYVDCWFNVVFSGFLFMCWIWKAEKGLGCMLRAGVRTLVELVIAVFLAVYMPAYVRGMQWLSGIRVIFGVWCCIGHPPDFSASQYYFLFFTTTSILLLRPIMHPLLHKWPRNTRDKLMSPSRTITLNLVGDVFNQGNFTFLRGSNLVTVGHLDL